MGILHEKVKLINAGKGGNGCKVMTGDWFTIG